MVVKGCTGNMRSGNLETKTVKNLYGVREKHKSTCSIYSVMDINVSTDINRIKGTMSTIGRIPIDDGK